MLGVAPIQPPRFGLIVLAAGLSRRMGGPNKLLQRYRGKPLLAHALTLGLEMAFTDCILVTGRDRTTIDALAAPYRFRPIYNERFEEGIGTSIAAGARALAPGVAGVFIALGDMPDLGAADYQALASMFKEKAIAAPTYGGRRGHPALFCARYAPELSALSDDEGARSILQRNASFLIKSGAKTPGCCATWTKSKTSRRMDKNKAGRWNERAAYARRVNAGPSYEGRRA